MAKGPSEKNTEEEFMWIAAVGLGILCVWLMWTYARHVILWFTFSFDLLQFWAIDFVFDFNATFKGYIQFMKGIYRSPEHPMYVNPFSITYAEMSTMSKIAGTYFRWVFATAIFGLAVVTMFKMKGRGFSRGFALAGGHGPSLAHYQAQHWKVFTPGANFNPDVDQKSDAPAATPMEWMDENNIGLSVAEGGLDYEAAADAFEKQLGSAWPGVEESPLYVKMLCVSFFLNAKRAKNARTVKEQISVAYSMKKTADRDKILKGIYEDTKKDPKFVKLIDKNGNKHAYTNTALFRLLTWARQNGGVCASAEFRWLKTIDRTMWYALNNCGRRAYHTEGAGTISHFNAENIVGGPLIDAHVDQAVDGLEDYLEHQGIYDLKEFLNGNDSEI